MCNILGIISTCTLHYYRTMYIIYKWEKSIIALPMIGFPNQAFIYSFVTCN